ncbi:MAG: hypothetical protein ABR521_09245 [Gaiellaceae bacterium]
MAREELTAPMRELGLHAWMQAPDWPFWKTGRPTDLTPDREVRRTEQEVRRPGTHPQSGFKLVGGGQVGPAALRGMQALHELSQCGFSILPFDEPTGPTIIEIFPRTLTGPVVKSDAMARENFVDQLVLDPDHRAAAISSEDAFDTLLSALRMAAASDELARLRRELDYSSEGKIWTTEAPRIARGY